MSKKAVPLIIMLVLVGGIFTWGAMTDWTFSGLLPREGAGCSPGKDDKDDNASEYVYDEDNECVVVNKCKKDWQPDTSNTYCEYSSGGTTCTPVGSEITNGIYTFDTTGVCTLDSCNGNFDLISGKCDTCKQSYMLKDGACVDPGLTVSSKKETMPEIYHGVAYLNRHGVTCEDGALNQFKLTGEKQGEYNYEYKCVEDIPGFSLGTQQTTEPEVKTLNSISSSILTEINVDCKKSPISHIKLNPTAAGNISYNYKCATNTVNKSTCKTKKSVGMSEVPDHRALINNDVKCDGKEVITQFQLKKEEGAKGKYYYDYKCCKMY